MPQLQIPAVEPADVLSNLERSESSGSPAVLDRASKLLDAIHRLGAPTPFIFPTEFGGIQFEWRGGRFELDLEILPETETVCVMFHDDEYGNWPASGRAGNIFLLLGAFAHESRSQAQPMRNARCRDDVPTVVPPRHPRAPIFAKWRHTYWRAKSNITGFVFTKNA
jgi:hypothetical protein